ncbi:TIGR04282 family arsenosugar biosynthesis glycosyltransferase [Spongiimicrobium sp. 3-5]|uniref:TIGR04282 family arsenosugar biosynthesis glycosyltransferase n=1 Tax=Spongiimicrobium sp. 3-5 TaxID=3332596 RepID=UPI00398188AF
MTDKENQLLLIFTRNPELGKCKTRLAATIGDQAALEIYRFLLNHTVTITKGLAGSKTVYYSQSVWENDIWDSTLYGKELQQGSDLGQRMENAFRAAFNAGFKKVMVIGSDMYDLDTTTLQEAFDHLDQHDYVLGPALDGGYYLLGMTVFTPALFENKAWGQETVLADTLEDLKNEKYKLMNGRNDIDLYEDIKDIEAFRPFLKNYIHDQ